MISSSDRQQSMPPPKPSTAPAMKKQSDMTVQTVHVAKRNTAQEHYFLLQSSQHASVLKADEIHKARLNSAAPRQSFEPSGIIQKAKQTSPAVVVNPGLINKKLVAGDM